MLLGLKNVSLRIGNTVLFDGTDFSIESRERVCLVGRNGAGKSTLFRIIAGSQAVDAGEVIRQQGLRVAQLVQDVPPGTAGTVYDVVAEGLGELGRKIAEFHHLSMEAHTEAELEKLGRLQSQIEAQDGWSLESRVQSVITKLDLPADAPFAAQSGGLKRRVLLAQALVSEPDILLLDEPTNHLDIPSIAQLEEFLLSFRGALLFISHDRAFVRKLATRVCDLDRGKLSSWQGGYDAYLTGKAEALHAEERQNALFDKKLAQEEVWIRKGVEARRTRSAGRVKALMELRNTFANRRNREGTANIVVQEAERSGKLVAELKNVTHSYNGRKIIHNLSTVVIRGDKVGIIGPNGAGKTTLLNIILGKLKPDSGEMREGTKLEIAYFDQLRSPLLDEEKTAIDAIGDGKEFVEIAGVRKHVYTYLQDFLFTPDRARCPVRVLSGGERSRLLLAQLFSRPSNLLVLDEPTNDLDMETLDLLEERLVEYSGTVLMVSHDREFLNNVVTRSLVYEGGGRVGDYIGGYDDWLRQRQHQAPTQTPPKPTAAPSPAPAAAAPASRLNSKDKRELDQLPGRIEKLEAEQTKLAAEISAPGFYQQPREAIAKVELALAKTQKELGTAYARWEELEAQR
ncbi:ATP-binding cassette domain-containing protein [Solimonas sp. SE-A11]|uniref:ATP-binding cassette domain-containing protein n=1 Tax=Solimonas sp. SE-A11 TaxID=3054954 RepID=UPI00259CE2DF|nr:ATP-binding cassette domain-containing protein [Solimonas sp. SE-A11]MDM4771037.1 ATP-binding cassette domain-containing protein [Solimonas sp. SE-A11]